MEVKDIEEILDLVMKGTELAEPLANAYWLLTETDPSHFKGFMGFVSNPQALANGLSSGVTSPTQKAEVAALQKKIQDAITNPQGSAATLISIMQDAYNWLRLNFP